MRFALGLLAKTDWSAPIDQEWYPYNYAEENIVVSLAELHLVGRSASGTKVREGGSVEVMPKYCRKLAYRGMLVEYVRIAWRRHLAYMIENKLILTLEELDAFTKPGSMIFSAAVAEVVVPKARLQ